MAASQDRRRCRCVFLDGIVMKRSRAGEGRTVSLLVAIGVTREGYRALWKAPGRTNPAGHPFCGT